MTHTIDPIQPVVDEQLTGEMAQATDADHVSTATEVQEPAAEEEGEKCPHCGKGGYTDAAWCKHCGFYAVLGRCVEIAEWEKDYDHGEFLGEEPKPTNLLFGAPIWMWYIAGALMGIMAITIAGRLITPPGSTSRIVWSLLQAGGGFLLFAVAYARVTYVAMSKNRQLDLSEVFLSPMRPWVDVIMDFPNSFGWVVTGACSIWATILAHVFLGVPYGLFIHFTSDPTPKKMGNPVAAIAKMAKADDKSMTMEEALDEFAGKAGAKDLADEAKKSLFQKFTPSKKEDLPAGTREIECAIIGYMQSKEAGQASFAFVVAQKETDRWRVLGLVSTGITPDIQSNFLESTKSMIRVKPVAPCAYRAVWLEPKLQCRVQAEFDEGVKTPKSMELLGM